MPSLTSPSPEPRAGTVVARFRRDFLVLDAAGRRLRCLSGRRELRPVVGDRVEIVSGAGASDAGRIMAVAPRRNCLERIDRRGRGEPMAANLSRLIVVIAAAPTPDRVVLDRYLCAAELLALPALVVCNKSDVAGNAPGLDDLLADYRAIGYPVLTLSARTGHDLQQLEHALRGERSTLVGQSGVGKSSLINRLVPQAQQAVGRLSDRSGAGRHTTTTAILYELPGGGEVIDSPGVRSYSPPLPEPARVQQGFREIVAEAGRCRFADCLHRAEPGCGVQAALARDAIRAERYASYCLLLEQAKRFEHPWGRSSPEGAP